MSVKVGNVTRGAIKTIIRAKCEAIKRPQLSDVNSSEIFILSFCKRNNTCICRVRGMKYEVNMSAKNPKIGTFEPGQSTPGTGCTVKRGPSYGL